MNHTEPTVILIADDDAAQLMLAEAALAGAGCIVHSAADGEEAVHRFAEVRPDCVILDVNMPKLSGIDACRAIRAQAGGVDLPILMLTGRNDLPAITDAYAAGASDFAQKGMNPRLLVERVRFLLRDRDLREELHSSQSKLLLAQRIARVGHWELTADGHTRHVSPVLDELLGVEAGTLRRYDDFVELLAPEERELVRAAFVTCATGHGGFGFDHLIGTADGGRIALHQEAELVDGRRGSTERTVIVTLQDLTRLHRAEETVRLLSYFDAATGLPNRRHLIEQVARCLSEPDVAAASAVVAFRLHDFDRIAQAQGSEFAGQLVTAVARRLEAELGRIAQGGSILWRSDLPAVCRSADGELALLLRSRVSAEHIATVTHAALQAIAVPGPALEEQFVPAVSAGVALLSVEAAGAEQLLDNAHAAVELARDPRSCAFFSPLPLAQARRRVLMEFALRGAVERRELQLLFLPRVGIESFDLAAVECVPRWQNAQFGGTRPEDFMAVAEDAGISDEIGRWMIEAACRQLSDWRERYPGRFFAALRVSARQLRDPRLVQTVETALASHHVPADSLQLEATPASIVDAPSAVRETLQSLHALGVRIGLREFGTAQSALGQMRALPCQSMTLDRSLLADLYTDPWAQGVTAAVLAMARAMRIRAVADGLEDGATLEMLRALGCEEIEGPYVAGPMKAKDFEHWLECGGAAHLARSRIAEPATEADNTEEEAYWASVAAGRAGPERG
ncbi:MAG TPA: EAL domain-containing protein [Steroidobacteraceae bacterium]|nr:EAL domain-containing protein [Steroidobacteraceae bacterium]